MKFHGALRIGVPRHEQQFAEAGLDRELLANLPDQAGFRRLVRLALATRKLPRPLKVCALQPAREEKRVVTLDDGGGDDDDRSPGKFRPSRLRAFAPS